jgi:hypothetical protein
MIMNKKKISILLFGLAICSIFILFSPQEVEAIGSICGILDCRTGGCVSQPVNCMCEIIVEAPIL